MVVNLLDISFGTVLDMSIIVWKTETNSNGASVKTLYHKETIAK